MACDHPGTMETTQIFRIPPPIKESPLETLPEAAFPRPPNPAISLTVVQVLQLTTEHRNTQPPPSQIAVLLPLTILANQ